MPVSETFRSSQTDCDQVLLNDCPLCRSRRVGYAFSHRESRVVRCPDCRLMFLNPQPSAAQLAAIYNADYFLGSETEEGRAPPPAPNSPPPRLHPPQLTPPPPPP